MKEWIILPYIGMTFLLLIAFRAMVIQYKDEQPWARTWPTNLFILVGVLHAVVAAAATVGAFD